MVGLLQWRDCTFSGQELGEAYAALQDRFPAAAWSEGGRASPPCHGLIRLGDSLSSGSQRLSTLKVLFESESGLFALLQAREAARVGEARDKAVREERRLCAARAARTVMEGMLKRWGEAWAWQS